MDWRDVVVYTLLVITLMSLVVCGYAVYSEHSTKTFTIRKNEFYCTASHFETQTVYRPMGKIVMPQTETLQYCDKYERISK